MTNEIRLREVTSNDLDVFFKHQCDPVACQMAAFTAEDPADRTAFDAHWNKILSDDSVTLQCIVWNDHIAGHIASFNRSDNREVTYWIGREFWGQGIATAALGLFLSQHESRPLFARVAADNLGSLRVLEKCGFMVIDQETGYANARGIEIDEFVLRLDDLEHFVE